jgi:hypothetical protein
MATKGMTITVPYARGYGSGVEVIAFSGRVADLFRSVDVSGAYIDAIDGVLAILDEAYPSEPFETHEAWAEKIVAALEEEA